MLIVIDDKDDNEDDSPEIPSSSRYVLSPLFSSLRTNFLIAYILKYLSVFVCVWQDAVMLSRSSRLVRTKGIANLQLLSDAVFLKVKAR
jgi:hypothetical protein